MIGVRPEVQHASRRAATIATLCLLLVGSLARGGPAWSGERPAPEEPAAASAQPSSPTGGDRESEAEGDRSPMPPAAEAARAHALEDRIRRAIKSAGVQVQVLGRAVVLEGTVESAVLAQRAERIAKVLAPDYEIVSLLNVHGAEVAARMISAALVGHGASVRALAPDTLLLEGRVTPDEAARIRKIVGTLEKEVKVLDALQEAERVTPQVLIRARVIDIDRRRLKEVGVDYGQRSSVGGGAVVDQPFRFGIFGQPSRGNLDVQPLDPLGARLSLLVQENAARILSEPNVLVLEGQKGSILVGGEIPIPVAKGLEAIGFPTGVTVEYKEFGVRMEVEPQKVVGDEITIKVTPEVSVLDYGNAVRVSGFTLPALRTRRTDSTVRIASGQTLAIGGLIHTTSTRMVRKIPGLGDVPILGELFKRRSVQHSETELVILITPVILSPGASTVLPPLAGEPPEPPSERSGRPDERSFCVPTSGSALPDVGECATLFGADQPPAVCAAGCDSTETCLVSGLKKTFASATSATAPTGARTWPPSSIGGRLSCRAPICLPARWESLPS